MTQIRIVKYIVTLLGALILSLPLQAGERVTIYAMLLDKTPVKLSSGAEWVMEKGDCFPIIAYKESRNKIYLRIAGAQFVVNAKQAREVKESEVVGAMENYRNNVSTYIQTAPDKWRTEAEAQEKKPNAKPETDEKK